MSTPIYDFRPEWNKQEVATKPDRPLILFAGEATTPYHPSTIHGAFETGIREAYRLDVALEPELNDITFDESYLYQPTFTVRRGKEVSLSNKPSEVSTDDRVVRKDHKCGSYSKRWWFDDDSSILRGVESFGLSESAMIKIKAKMMAPDNNFSMKDIEERYNSLIRRISSTDENNADAEAKRKLPGRRVTWFAADVHVVASDK